MGYEKEIFLFHWGLFYIVSLLGLSFLKSDTISLIFQNTINGKVTVYRILWQKYVKNITQALMVLPPIPGMEKITYVLTQRQSALEDLLGSSPLHPFLPTITGYQPILSGERAPALEQSRGGGEGRRVISDEKFSKLPFCIPIWITEAPWPVLYFPQSEFQITCASFSKTEILPYFHWFLSQSNLHMTFC